MKKAHQLPGPGKAPMRHCHDCGKPCWDYRCPDCWQKIRNAPACADIEADWCGSCLIDAARIACLNNEPYCLED